MSPLKRLKQRIWLFLYPFFPHIEHLFIFLHKKRRQRYHIGWLAEGKTLEEMKHHLSTHYGFGNHFVAWEDPDQVLSWRKLVGFEYQYHLRVFSDGELRGHYEPTPESAPLDHFFEKDEKQKNADFVRFLGHFLSKMKYEQHPPLVAQKRTTEPELTFATLRDRFKKTA